MKKLLLALCLLASGTAQAQWQVPNGAIPIGRGPGVTGFNSATGASGAGAKCLLDTTPPSFGPCSSSLAVGTSTVTGGTNGGPLYVNSGVLGGGTRSGSTTQFATINGSLVSTNCLQADASGNIVDAGAPCGTGNNTSNTQDFIAGVGFTAGSTTSLTTSSTPINAASTTVTFDGIVQSHNTWSLVGSTITFSAAIPTNVQVVEVFWLSTATGGSSAGGSVDNFLPNTQWQLWTLTNDFFGSKHNAAGTALQTAATCASFTTSTTIPVFTCANTQGIKANDIVVLDVSDFWTFNGIGRINCTQVQCYSGSRVTGSRVTSVLTNTSVTMASPGLGGASPSASTLVNMIPIAPGDVFGTKAIGADGWSKTTTLVATTDDWGAAATPASTVYPGCIRPLLLRKGVTGSETYRWEAPANAVTRFRGRTVTFSVMVYQRVQGGASTWRSYITDSAGTTNSTTGTGASFGTYQFRTVTRTVSATATSLAIGIETQGNSGDVFDVCLPTAGFVSSMAESQLGQRSREVIRARSHWNPPLLTPLKVTTPPVELVSGSGLYGWNGIDLEAMSLVSIHNSLSAVYAKLELTTPSPNMTLFTGANVSAITGLTFGPQATTQVAGIMFSTNTSKWPLWHDGTATIFSNNGSFSMTSSTVGCTFDFTDVESGGGDSLN